MTNSIFDDYEYPFDIVKYIASFNPETWFRMMRINDAFAQYSRTDAGKREYVRLFTLITYVNDMSQTSLFGIVHSIYDEPAINYQKYQIKLWYINGLISRNCDLPAYVDSEYTEWRLNGLVHRDNDKPAVIDKEAECKKWFTNGKLHRDNDLPAVVDFDGMSMWFLNGKYVKTGQYSDIVDVHID